MRGWLFKVHTCRYALLGIVFYINLLDYMLLTAVVPILPELLVESDSEGFTEVRTGFTNGSSQGNVSYTNTTEDEQCHSFRNGSVYFLTTLQGAQLTATSENSKVGWLLSSKALVQIVASPVIGFVSSRVTNKHLLLFGTGILMTSASIFACSGNFLPLLMSRSLQGLGSAATSISGMSLLAETYSDDKERSRVMSIGLSGLGVGVLIGYPFGGLIFATLGRAVPFVGIAILCLVGIVLFRFVLTSVLQVKFTDHSNQATRYDVSVLSIWRLCKDPYILICSGALMLTAMSMSVLESTVPIWVMDTMTVQQWQLGIIFIPDSLGYFFGIYGFPVIAKKYGRWLFTLGSMMLIVIGAVIFPFCRRIEHLIVPHFFIGFGVGVTDAAIYPLLALLVDQRHVTTYGSVYSMGQLAVCLAFFFGPVIAGQIVPVAGFKWSMWGIAILNFSFAPLCMFLRSPPVLEDKMRIIDGMEETFHGDYDDETVTYHTFDGVIDKQK